MLERYSKLNPSADLSKVPEEVDQMLNEPILGISRQERMDQAEGESFEDFFRAMGG